MASHCYLVGSSGEMFVEYLVRHCAIKVDRNDPGSSKELAGLNGAYIPFQYKRMEVHILLYKYHHSVFYVIYKFWFQNVTMCSYCFFYYTCHSFRWRWGQFLLCSWEQLVKKVFFYWRLQFLKWRYYAGFILPTLRLS